MFKRHNTGSVVCPNCGRLVGVRDASCFNCGRSNPGMFGWAPALQKLGRNFSFADVVIWGCAFLYLATLLFDVEGMSKGGLFSMFGPSPQAAFVFGNAGHAPVFELNRWWTVLSAGWLHGGLIHIGFNLYWAKNLIPPVTQIFGPGRMVIIYTVSSAVGFALTSVLFKLQLPILHGARLSLGASAAICGMVGALLLYARISGQRQMREQLMRFVIMVLALGLLVRGIDNWAHIGGFLGGYLCALLLRPLEDESPVHLVAGGICLLATLAALVASFVVGIDQLPQFEQMFRLR